MSIPWEKDEKLLRKWLEDAKNNLEVAKKLPYQPHPWIPHWERRIVFLGELLRRLES